MHIDDYFKNYKPSKTQLEHALQVEKLSLCIYEELKRVFKDNKELQFKDAYKLISYSAKLHDIGMFFDRTKVTKPHNKIGAKLVLENKIDGLEESQNLVVAASIRYHRGSKPKDGKHRLYSSLGNEDKTKVKIIASIIRIADALDFNHIGTIENVTLCLNDTKSALTLNTGVNIMYNAGIKNAFIKKKSLFGEVFGTQIYLNND